MKTPKAQNEQPLSNEQKEKLERAFYGILAVMADRVGNGDKVDVTEVKPGLLRFKRVTPS